MGMFGLVVGLLCTAWLSLLYRKLARLTAQRTIHFDRLLAALGGAGYDENDPASLDALAKMTPGDPTGEARQARWLFNEATMAINVRVETIPTRWFARAMGYRALPYFDA